MADGATQQIKLSTKDGLTGYRINKFQLMPETPNVNQESLMVITSVKPEAVATSVNFDSPLILATGLYMSKESTLTQDINVVFENIIFNQDIYITHNEGEATRGCNFYLELEQVSLDLNEATVATMKDMRGRE